MLIFFLLLIKIILDYSSCDFLHVYSSSWSQAEFIFWIEKKKLIHNYDIVMINC